MRRDYVGSEGEFYENRDDHDEEDIAEEAAKPMNKMDPDQRLYCCKVPRQECQCGDGHSPGVLLQTQETKHKDIILQMAKLLDTLEEPGAKAALVWVVEEYCEMPQDVVRKMTTSRHSVPRRCQSSFRLSTWL